jgi:hypothetical protein
MPIVFGKPKVQEANGKTWNYVEDNIKMGLRHDGVLWAGLIWLRIRVSGGLL